MKLAFLTILGLITAVLANKPYRHHRHWCDYADDEVDKTDRKWDVSFNDFPDLYVMDNINITSVYVGDAVNSTSVDPVKDPLALGWV